MTRELRNCHVMAHVSARMKSRLATLARSRGITESALVNLILAENLDRYEKSAAGDAREGPSREAGSAKKAPETLTG